MQTNVKVEHSDFLLYNGDCRNVMSALEKKVDMIFADPPYFLSTGKGTVKIGQRYINFNKGDWDRIRTNSEKDEFNYEWLKNVKKY